MRQAFELIDTCWDVNSIEVPQDFKITFELIDTCWDVNIVTDSLQQQ